MDAQKDENLTELFAKFVDNEQADELSAQVIAADQIIDGFAAPGPDDVLLTGIKADVARRLNANRSSQMIYRLVAAAVFLIVAALGVKLFQQRPVESPPVAMATWELVEVISADAELSTLIAEVEQIESDFVALQFAESGDDSFLELNDLEMELNEINSDVWKGWNNENEDSDNSVNSDRYIGNNGIAVSCGRRRQGEHLA